MARVTVPVTQFTRDGVAIPTAVTGDATNNHVVVNDGKVGIIAKNTGAGARTVTFQFSRLVDGKGVTARVETLAAGAEEGFGPFPTNDYGTTLNIDVAHAEVTLRAIRI